MERILFFLGVTFLFVSTTIFAGPPFLTDDPIPTDYKHWEIYLFEASNTNKTTTTIAVPAVEINYGLCPNIELNAVIPFTFSLSHTKGSPTGAGLGDIQLGMKYRFVNEAAYRPAIAFSPVYVAASGNSYKGLGNGKQQVVLPIFAQKSWEPWTVFGGGGYTVNHAAGKLNYGFGGIVAERDFGSQWTLGAEIFTLGPTAVGEKTTAIFNAGGSYNVSKTFNILFTAGRNVIGETNIVTYLGGYWLI